LAKAFAAASPYFILSCSIEIEHKQLQASVESLTAQITRYTSHLKGRGIASSLLSLIYYNCSNWHHYLTFPKTKICPDPISSTPSQSSYHDLHWYAIDVSGAAYKLWRNVRATLFNSTGITWWCKHEVWLIRLIGKQ
jgi:hypothetical protein